MSNYYYINDIGFIEFAGKFESNQDADEFLELKQIDSFWLFSENYLKVFIDSANKTIQQANKG